MQQKEKTLVLATHRENKKRNRTKSLRGLMEREMVEHRSFP